MFKMHGNEKAFTQVQDKQLLYSAPSNEICNPLHVCMRNSLAQGKLWVCTICSYSCLSPSSTLSHQGPTKKARPVNFSKDFWHFVQCTGQAINCLEFNCTKRILVATSSTTLGVYLVPKLKRGRMFRISFSKSVSGSCNTSKVNIQLAIATRYN